MIKLLVYGVWLTSCLVLWHRLTGHATFFGRVKNFCLCYSHTLLLWCYGFEKVFNWANSIFCQIKGNIRKNVCMCLSMSADVFFYCEYSHYITEMNTHSLKPRFHEHNGCVLLIRHMKKLKKKKERNKKKAGDLCSKSWQFGISEYLHKRVPRYNIFIYTVFAFLFPQTM